MKNLFRQFSKVLSIALFSAAIVFSGCNSETPFQAQENHTKPPLAQGSLNKMPTPTAIYKEGFIKPDSGGTLKINGKNFNEATFKVNGGNVSVETAMTLIKLSETSNMYHLTPFGMSLPAGVSMTLAYDHSAMPFGVTESDLKVFYLTDIDTVALVSQVKTNHMEVKAEALSSGEFALGAYDVNGKLQLIEGEFGLRNEDWINPKKGGVIKLGGGSKLCIPKGALNDRTLIGMIATRETIQGKGDSKAFTFTPHGTNFNVPVELVLSWREFDGEDIVLYYFNEMTGAWEINGQGVWDPASKTVTIQLHHFSRYALARS